MSSFNDRRPMHSVLDRALSGMSRTAREANLVRPFALLVGVLALGSLSVLPSNAEHHPTTEAGVAGAMEAVDAAGGDNHAFQPVPPRSFIDSVKGIADWVIDNSSYVGYRHLPSFVVVPSKTLNYIVHHQTIRGYAGQGNILTHYLPNVILLSDKFDLGRHQEMIVHELVRHFQFESGSKFDCPQQAEREASEIQIKWMEEAGKGSRPDGHIHLLKLPCRTTNTPQL